MGLVEQISEAMRPRRPRSWPAGPGSLAAFEGPLGHDTTRFSPEEYGDYLATSNEIYAAANLRARLMSGLRLKAYAGEGPARRELPEHPAARLLKYVNPHWTQRRLARMDELSMCLWGMSYWAIERDENRRPSEIWWMKAPRVHPVVDEKAYLSHFLYEPVSGGKPIRFETDEIVWFRYPNPIDEFSPISPMAAARLPADTGRSMMTSNRNLFLNGLAPGGVIVPTGDQVTYSKEQADDLAELLGKRFKGEKNRHRWAVLRFDAKLQELSVTPKDAEFVAGLNLTLRQVCNAYGIPSPLLNDMEHATLANLRELLTAVWTLALVPDSMLKADEIGEQFLPMFGTGGPDHVEHDYTRVPELQESASEIWGRERQAIEIGRKTINEIRLEAGEPPLPWGDVWWAPVNKFAVVDDASAPSSSAADGLDSTAGDPAGGPEGAVDDQGRALLLSAFGINGHQVRSRS